MDGRVLMDGMDVYMLVRSCTVLQPDKVKACKTVND